VIFFCLAEKNFTKEFSRSEIFVNASPASSQGNVVLRRIRSCGAAAGADAAQPL
jgi:hypothetical protein